MWIADFFRTTLINTNFIQVLSCKPLPSSSFGPGGWIVYAQVKGEPDITISRHDGVEEAKKELKVLEEWLNGGG